MSNILAVIDSDTPAFAAAISCEEYQYRDPVTGYAYHRKGDIKRPDVKKRVVQEWDTTTPPKFAIARCRKYMDGVLDDVEGFLGSDFDYVCMVGVGANYRYDLPNTTGYPYKGNRKDLHTPEYLEICKESIIKDHPSVPCDGYEADDGCGIVMASGMDGYDELVVVHIDKDMDMIPGKHVRWSRVISGRHYPGDYYEVSEVQGLRAFYKQMLKGDSTDNIPGYHKLTGKKLMKRLLEPINKMTTEPEMWTYVSHLYAEAGMTDVGILQEIGRLLWIQRKEGELWTIPTAR